MGKDQSDTYSVSFGKERIAEIRNIARVTGLQQSEIVQALWDEFKMPVIQSLLREKEGSLEGRLEEIQAIMKQIETSASEHGLEV
jgi:hypothetical protein